MKKKIYILFYTIMFVGLLGFNSCDKKLDINISKELESNYFGSEYRITQGVGAAYAEITNIYGGDLNKQTKHGFWLLPADDVTFDGTGSSLETFQGLNGDNGSITAMWSTYYKTIARCNFMLFKITEPSVAKIYHTPGLMDANQAEMLFIRSWCNFKLWDNWKKAPLQIKRIISADDAKLPPSSGFDLLDNAISSLETAAPLAKDSWNNMYLGRITKDACYGLLVKLYITRACYNSKNVDDYNKAIIAFGKISSAHLAQFKSVTYGTNFDYRNENNAESLFEFQASIQPSGMDNPWLDNDFGGDIGMMASFYHYQDGHWSSYSSGVYGPTAKLVNSFDPDDPRLNETLKSDAWDKFGGYQFVKYINGNRSAGFDPIWGIGSNNNPRLLRLADVKLCVAEAYLATGNSAEALKQVNDIRERARLSVTPASLAPADLAIATISDIMNERLRELAGEDGHRWSDLKRWHAAGYINLGNWTAADFGFPSQYNAADFKFDVSKNLLFPIPTDELNKNPLMAASGNNPGY